MSYALDYDLTLLYTDGWTNLLATNTITNVNSIDVKLYTDNTFSLWAESNSDVDLAAQYSDNVLAVHCTIEMFDGLNYLET